MGKKRKEKKKKNMKMEMSSAVSCFLTYSHFLALEEILMEGDNPGLKIIQH